MRNFSASFRVLEAARHNSVTIKNPMDLITQIIWPQSLYYMNLVHLLLPAHISLVIALFVRVISSMTRLFCVLFLLLFFRSPLFFQQSHLNIKLSAHIFILPTLLVVWPVVGWPFARFLLLSFEFVVLYRLLPPSLPLLSPPHLLLLFLFFFIFVCIFICIKSAFI